MGAMQVWAREGWKDGIQGKRRIQKTEVRRQNKKLES